MGLLEITKLGNPALRIKTRPVPEKEITTRKFRTLLNDMVETMRENEGIGLAGPQVDFAGQVFVIDAIPAEEGEEGGTDVMHIINPRIKLTSDERVLGWEGCLSISDLRGLVPRSPSVFLEALDASGKPFSLNEEGYLARVIQHEFDHLEGILFLDRMENMDSLTHLAEYNRYWVTPTQT